MRRGTMTKQLELTLVGPGHANRSATATLTSRDVTWSATDWVAAEWTATAVVLLDGDEVRHTTDACTSERSALLAVSAWLRERFGASATCLGSRVSIVSIVGVVTDERRAA